MPASKDFSEESSPIKRDLSLYEKGSLPSTSGKALVFLGESGMEIEELAEAGMDPSKIVGIDSDPRIVHKLRNIFHDYCTLLHVDVLSLIECTRTPHDYSYVHVDLCGCLNPELCTVLENIPRLLRPASRVRITAFDPKRHPSVRKAEREYIDSILAPLCEIGYDAARQSSVLSTESWAKSYAYLDSADTTHAIFAHLVCSLFFGYEFDRVATTLAKHELPVANGNHVFSRIENWKYKEASTSNYMMTSWVDLRGFPTSSERSNDMWILSYLQRVFASVLATTPVYSPLAIIERPF